MTTFDTTDSVKHIWIYQKGNGMVAVFPSPAVVKAGASFDIVNKTGEDATVNFPAGVINANATTVPVSAGGSTSVTALANASGYFEYDAAIAGGGGRLFYAEGNSKPNIIIQP
jgi:hypothetical protein